MSKKIRVLVVDDSAVVRQTLTMILESDSEIEVMGIASDPYMAAKKILSEVPDVITLDIEMPRMDGLTFLRKIMSQHPIPVVIVSSLSTQNSETTLKAIEYGAVDIITKPEMYTKTFFEESKIQICDVVKAAAKAVIHRYTPVASQIKVQPKFSTDAVLPKTFVSESMIKTTEKVIVVGASTGGTEALLQFLQALPSNAPAIVIVQHMPENFTKSFANRLNDLCQISVKEAENGDSVIRGRALIAPGNYHMVIKRSGAKYYVEVIAGELVNRHRPSVDVLFRSAAQYVGANAIGVIMTGMGNDGANGLLEMKQAGAYTIAQDEKSCVVYGMPKEAVKLGAADIVLPLNQIAGQVMKMQF